jgi:hypothetical protein
MACAVKARGKADGGRLRQRGVGAAVVSFIGDKNFVV